MSKVAWTPPASSPGNLLRLIRESGGCTRSELIQRSALSRATITGPVSALRSFGLVDEVAGATHRGRPPSTLTFNSAAGVVLAAELGVKHSSIAVADLGGALLGRERIDHEGATSAELIVAAIHDHVEVLLNAHALSPSRIWAIGVAELPRFATRPAGAEQPISVTISDRLRRRYEAPILVDDPVNALTRAEHRNHWRHVEHLLYVSVDAAIACGIVSSGDIHRSARGIGSDLGHIQLAGYDDALCPCGSTGCLDAIAGGDALAARLTAAGRPAGTVADVAALARGGDPLAMNAIRDAGRALGHVLSRLVTFFNPEVMVIGGRLSAASDELLVGIREVVTAHAPVVTTRDLLITSSSLDEAGVLTGLTIMAIDAALAPANVDRMLARPALPGVGREGALRAPAAEATGAAGA